MEHDAFDLLFRQTCRSGNVDLLHGLLSRHARPEEYVRDLTTRPLDPAWGIRPVDWVSLLFRWGDRCLWSTKRMVEAHGDDADVLSHLVQRGLDVDTRGMGENSALLDLSMATRLREADSPEGQLGEEGKEWVRRRMRLWLRLGARPDERGFHTGLSVRDVCEGHWMASVFPADGSETEFVILE